MRLYRTEIVIPPDRYVSLQLPADWPEGRAHVTVLAAEPDPEEVAGAELDLDRQDIEWWDEFEDPGRDDPHALSALR